MSFIKSSSVTTKQSAPSNVIARLTDAQIKLANLLKQRDALRTENHVPESEKSINDAIAKAQQEVAAAGEERMKYSGGKHRKTRPTRSRRR
jgi:hypothetical protein